MAPHKVSQWLIINKCLYSPVASYRFLLVTHSHEEKLLALAAQHAALSTKVSPLLALFPDLRLHLTWEGRSSDEPNETRGNTEAIDGPTLEVHGAVHSAVLHDLLTALPLRMPDSKQELAVFWHAGARLVQGNLADPFVQYCRSNAEGLSVHIDFGPSSDKGNREAVRDLMTTLLKTKGRVEKIQVHVKEADGK